MCNLIGKENVVYSAIHFDENTPHMHFYFTPVVHEVKRKVFETDKDGHQILKPYITKDGIEKMIPTQKKDDYNKFINEIEGNIVSVKKDITTTKVGLQELVLVVSKGNVSKEIPSWLGEKQLTDNLVKLIKNI